MQSFAYKAKGMDGRLITGEIQAEDRPSVVSMLKKKGYFVLSVEPEQRLVVSIQRKFRFLEHRVPLRQKAVFTQQLATLLKAGMQLTVALKTLSRQMEDKFFASIIHRLYQDIEESSSLSQTMSNFPNVFPPTYTAIVGAAEESGSLVESLTNLSKQIKSQAAICSRIRGALAYPLFLLLVSILVVGVLVSFVIPKFIELFVNANQKLPLPTLILLHITDFFKAFWWVFPPAIIGAIFLAAVVLKNEKIKSISDTCLLRFPLLGRLNLKIQLAQFTRTLGSLLDGGVRILPAVQIARGTTRNLVFAQNIRDISSQITKGATLAQAIKKQPFFTELTASMIAVGEDSGMLPEMLLEVAEIYEQEAEATINSLTGLLGPMIVVFIGLVIGFVVMAILLPIFEASTMVG